MMEPAWARAMRDQCRELGVAFFMKQMTKRVPIPKDLAIREWPGRARGQGLTGASKLEGGEKACTATLPEVHTRLYVALPRPARTVMTSHDHG
jgi:hypothetical protein